MGSENLTDNGLNKEVKDTPGGSEDAASVDLLQVMDSFWKKLLANRKLALIFRTILILISTLLLALSAIIFILYFVPVLTDFTSGHKPAIVNNGEPGKNPDYKKQFNLISRDLQSLSRKYNAYTSGQTYIVINTTDNRFYLYQNKKLIREGFCSSGSYTMLQTEGNKKWVFKTPKGKYRILGKTTNPVWKKPDWAFVEEGLPIPPKNDNSRYEYGVLGAYALSIGDGYMIHGTLYKRFLGMPVTHGCVRLNDEDLKVIYNNLNIGSKVYIF
jgi:lipoprotein-anchoring transpeptidase ErfK/SrfK